MTRKETEEALKNTKALAEPPNYGASFKQLSLLYEIALYEECLKYGVDPDSILFYYEAIEGKGKKW